MIKTIQTKTATIDVNSLFRNYKYAIQEHAPIRLSNGMWLHTYRLTKYNDSDPHGDQDVERDAFYNEQF
jgi:hypothetical protein